LSSELSASESGEPRDVASSPRLVRAVTIITFAKAWFVVAGYGLYFGLTRLLGPRDFGLYAVVTSIVSVINNVLIAATLQAVSRFTAASPDRAGTVLRTGLGVQSSVGAGLFVLLQLVAGPVAHALRDPRIEAPLRIAAAIVPAYAMYAVNVGFLNGSRRFGRQASLDITYSTLRLGLIMGMVALGLGVPGAVGGFAAAAFVILLVSIVMVRREPRPEGEFALSGFLRFGGWLAVLTLLANLVLTADLWIVKRFTDPAIANEQAGLFRAALTLAQLLYQMLIPLALVLFPTLAHLGTSPDPAVAGPIVRGAFRYLTVTVIPGAALLGAAGTGLVSLLYGAAYAPGGDWLVFLAPAYAGWTMAYMLAVALSGAGEVRSGVVVLLVGVVCQGVAGVLLVPAMGPRGVALGDLIGTVLALATGLVFAGRRFGSIVNRTSLLHGLLLAGVFIAVVKLVPTPAWALPVKILVCVAAGAAFLLARGELRLPGRAPLRTAEAAP
jgi:O-antigen/teichoic acid export membrane protein